MPAVRAFRITSSRLLTAVSEKRFNSPLDGTCLVDRDYRDGLLILRLHEGKPPPNGRPFRIHTNSLTETEHNSNQTVYPVPCARGRGLCNSGFRSRTPPCSGDHGAAVCGPARRWPRSNGAASEENCSPASACPERVSDRDAKSEIFLKLGRW